MFGFRNVKIYKEKEGIVRGNIQIENGKIVSFEDHPDLINLPDHIMIVPGFIDEHMHGASGHDVMDGTFESLDCIATSIAQDGVTSFLATTMTMAPQAIEKALQNIADFMKVQTNGAHVLGVHLEGPFISKTFCGAQDPSYIIEPSRKKMSEYLKIAPIRMVTFAYEENGKDMLSYLIENHICPSLGHSNATAAQAKEAFDHGVNCTTHTYNAMRGIHHRDVGVVGEAFLHDHVYSELICDFHHVSKEAIKLLYQNKGKDKIILITDSMEARFLENGRYSLGGQDVFVKDGVATLENGVLAGSVLRMNEAIRNIYQTLPIRLEEAIDMASKNPAQHLGIYDHVGSLQIGKDADFVFMDEQFTIYATYAKGQKIYERKEELE